MTQFDGLDIVALFVEQEGGDINRHLGVDGCRVVLHRLFFKDAQDMQRGRFGAADVTGAGAARAGDVVGFGQCGTQALTREFHQAKTADLAGLHAGAVQTQAFAQAVFHLALVALAFHVDEVDDDEPPQVAQAQLAGDFFRRFEVGLEGGFLNVGTTRRTAGVDVDRDQRFGMVDDNGSAGRQDDLPRVGRFDLVFDLEA